MFLHARVYDGRAAALIMSPTNQKRYWAFNGSKERVPILEVPHRPCHGFI